MEVTIDFSNIKNMEDFYIELSKQMELPAHFGNNLDALNDVIGEVEKPFTLNFNGLNIPRYESFTELIDALDEMTEELENFEFSCYFED